MIQRDEPETLPIVFQDETLIAVNKPSGLLVHRSMIDRHETRFALQLVRDQIGQRVYPVHRLDKPTSGVLLFALSSEIAQNVAQQFTDQTIHKTYRAVVRGYTKESGTINYPLKEQLDKMTDRLANQHKEAQEAITSYRTLATTELPYPIPPHASTRYSLLELKPTTGRKHQLRRHMKHIFHPIVGDTSHGDGKHNQLFRDQFDCHRLLLHHRQMRLRHPMSGEEIILNAQLDSAFSRILKETGLQQEG